MEQHLSGSITGGITKENFWEAVHLIKENADREWRLTQEMIRNNPFWPTPMTPELLELVKEWADERKSESTQWNKYEN